MTQNNEYAGDTESHVWSKPQFQSIKRDMVRGGFPFTKLDAGYECRMPNGKLLLKAMNGRNTYLVRHVTNLFA